MDNVQRRVAIKVPPESVEDVAKSVQRKTLPSYT
jgi:hypothetical protein